MHAATPKPLELVGMDSWYTAYAPEYAWVFGPAVESFFDAAGRMILPPDLRDVLRATAEARGPASRTVTAGTIARDRSAFTALIALLDANAAALSRVHGAKRVASMRLRLEDRALYGRFHDTLDPARTTEGGHPAPREAHIGMVLDYLVNEHHADRKIIVWATHSQVMKNRTALGLYGHDNAADMLAAKLPADAMIGIGFTAHEGLSGDGRGLLERVAASLPGSLEWAANEVGPEYQLIDLRKLNGLYRAKLAPGSRVTADWKRSFDLVFYLKTQRLLTVTR